MPNDSHQHVVKTTSQWNDRAVEYWVVPRGCLCVELTPDGKTKLKIGEGNKYYHQLPYVTDGSDLSQYYTKEEIDNLLNNFNRMAIMDTEEKESKDDLPLDGNKLGDVYLVKSQDPSTKPDPDVYLWTGSKWIYVGYDFTNIDLSHYLTKEEFHQLFDNVQEKVDIMWPKMHSHQNINVLDRIEEPYTTAEKEKLAGLRNYDSDIDQINYDIDLLMVDKHHHDNKSFLDTITEDYQIWSIADREKFDNIPDYSGVIAEIQYEIQVLNEKSHTHGIDGKGTLDILNQIEEPYTTAEKEKLAGLENYSDFIGTNGMYSGTHGLVPAPSTRDVGKVLSSTGTWVSLPEITVNDFTGATDSTDGAHGLVPAPLAGEETYFLCGDGTWKEIEIPEYDAGIGLTLGTIIEHNQNTDIPEEYIQVEYLESTGTQYINLNGLAIWDQIDITIDFSITHIVNDTWISGNGNSYYGYCKGLGMLDNALRKPDTNTTYDPDILQENLRVIGFYHADESYQSVFVFARSDMYGRVVGNSQCRIYSISTVETSSQAGGNGKKCKFFPCIRRADNVPGLYDTENDAFFTNSGTDAFLYGPEMRVKEVLPGSGNTFNVNVGEGLIVDDDNFINNDGILDITQDDADSSNILTIHFRDNVTKDVTIDTGVVNITQEDPNKLNELTIESSDGTTSVITIPTGTGGAYTAGDGINITSDATPVIEAKLGKGLYFDKNDAIAADAYTAGQGISMSNQSGISVLNQEYYFDTQVTCSLSGSFQRSFQKTTNEPALGALINVHNVGQSDSWTGPVFVGLTESSVKCTYNTDNVVGPFTYKGKTWYCTEGNWWVDGSLTDDNNNILRIPGQNQSVFPDEINDFTIAKLIIDTAGLLDNNDKVITAKLGSGLRFDSNDAIETEPQYVRVSTTDSFVLLHTKPSDWDTNWDKYYELTYDQLPGVPPDWDPTKHYKYINDNYVLGSPGDTFVSTTWYDKHYVGLDPNTPIVFDSDVYYTGDLSLITDGENFDTAFEKVNEAIQHVERLENEVGFLKGSSVGIRTTSDPERIEFYRT